jgi:hypothetical protein
MSAYKLEKVIRLWDVGKLTTEQAIGQILQLIKERDKRLQELEGRVASLRKTLNRQGERGTGHASGENSD